MMMDVDMSANESVTVRRAQRSDVSDIADLAARYWEFEGLAGFARARTEKNLTVLLSLPERGACWIAERGGAICAYLLAVYLFSLEHGGMMAEIDEFFVRPDSRSAGTGTTILQFAEREMKTAGLARVQLQVGVTNHRARGFYERQGYRRRSGYELLDKSLADCRVSGPAPDTAKLRARER
jgi:ribosomal protein S18 acetylase RimI-like enzyme